MKILIIKLMLLVSVLINFLKNPLSMGIMLLIQTFLSVMLISLISTSSWFALITFLMMIGGLLILIMYMSSIASNEKFKININLSFILFILIFILDELMTDYLIDDYNELNKLSMLNISLLKIYNIKSMYLTLMLVIFLLLTMVSVSEIVKVFEGPLRMFSYE